MNLDAPKLREILVSQNYISEKDLEQGETWAKQNRSTVLDYLLYNGVITKELLGQAIAEFYKVPFTDLGALAVAREEIGKLPEILARKYRCFVVREDAGSVYAVTDDPTQADLQSELKKIFPQKEIRLTFGLPEEIDPLFVYYLKPLETRFAGIIKERRHVAPEILEEIFNDAIVFRASDIHFEPHGGEILIRFRIDGVLHEAGRIDKIFYGNILNRIKVFAHLRTDEHFSAQDGSLEYQHDKYKVAMRVSVVPTIDGEEVVIRLLTAYVKQLSLEELGLANADRDLLLEAAHKPFGMILVTGPTGSGKTTTLYALMNVIRTPQVNVITIEDPVEYRMENINQIQVDPKTNLTFAAGLKSILRQDPDIILVGEIRDKETAEIATNASLTGHLLFSTFHANDAATAIPRLLEIGVEPFLVASSLSLILAQRLVRRICEGCRFSTVFNKPSLEKIFPDAARYFPDDSTTLYSGKGCNLCHDTGFRGRIGVFELIPMSAEIQDLVVKNPSTKQIWQLAKKQGGHSLFVDGIEKVKNGVTTLEELLRVVPEPTDGA